MQSGDCWCRHRSGRLACGGCGLSVSGADEGGHHGGPTSDTCGGEQLATTKFKVESDVLCGHRAEVLHGAGRAYRNLTTVRQPVLEQKPTLSALFAATVRT